MTGWISEYSSKIIARSLILLFLKLNGSKVCVDGTFVAAPTHSFSKLLSAEGEKNLVCQAFR